MRPRAARRLATASKSATRGRQACEPQPAAAGTAPRRPDVACRPRQAHRAHAAPACPQSSATCSTQELVEELGTPHRRWGRQAGDARRHPPRQQVRRLPRPLRARAVRRRPRRSHGKVVVRRSYDRDERTGRRAETLVEAHLRRSRRRRRPPVARHRRGESGHRRRPRHGRRPPPTSGGPASISGGGLSAGVSVPVHVVNDANAAALAELVFGAGEAQNLILVRVDEGVGAGHRARRRAVHR